MNIDVYEKVWMWMAACAIALFVTVIGVSSYAYGQHPPSHVETIDPKQVFQDPRFAKVGVPVTLADGTVEIAMAASMFTFIPNEVHLPVGRPIRFRLTSLDVTHGFLISGTNANAMLVPGYITQFTTAFSTPGDYLLVCHEFCGNGHHAMFGRIIVEATR